MSEDLILQQRIIDELVFNSQVDAAHIGVSVHDGVVTLSGHVESFVEKLAAAQVARRVKGVKALAQQIEVHLPTDRKTADDEIAARAVRILEWDVVLAHFTLEVKVEHGVVTLSGSVDSAYQRAEAEHDVRKLGGVTAVINDILIQHKADAADIRAQICAALQRSAELQADAIRVDVIEGNVVLSGRVHSWFERDAAEDAAWSASGVVAVKNYIFIADQLRRAGSATG